MNADEMKKCPYCAEMIRAEAIKCRYCGSMLSKEFPGGLGSPHGYWHRVAEGKKIAGICTGIAYQLDAPVLILWLRVFFAISTLFYGFGPILYVLLWLLMPAPSDEQPATQPAGATGATVNPSGDSPSAPAQAPPAVASYPGSQAAAPPAGAKMDGADDSAQTAEKQPDEGTSVPDEGKPDKQEPEQR